jgi:hypothetical protein
MHTQMGTSSKPVTHFERHPVPESAHRPLALMGRATGIGVLLTALVGCASVQVTDVVSTSSKGSPPAEILVEVSTATTLQDAQPTVAREVATKMESDLVERLRKAGISSAPFAPEAHPEGAAILHVSVVEAEQGNAFERVVIGFGVGRAKLDIKADLESADPAGPHPMTEFEASSHSGFKPGLILPGGVALATRDAVHLLIGGTIDVATNIRGGLAKPVKRTTTAVVDQLKKYYSSVGWQWPTTAQS